MLHMSANEPFACWFYIQGRCRKGNDCPYLHDRSAPVNMKCRFYQKGSCKFGTSCRFQHADPPVQPSYQINRICTRYKHSGVCAGNCPFIHGQMCPYCELFVINPYSEEEEHNCDPFVFQKRFSPPSSEKTCAICYQNIVDRKQQFGLQEKCNHVFCVPCLKKWRHRRVNGNRVRTCPLCRTVSLAVVPTMFFPDPEEKKLIFDGLIASRAQIPCRYVQMYKEPLYCPYGTLCQFNHDV